jgi:hypothetical protein
MINKRSKAMNKRQAQQKGYVFTGAYSHDKEEMKERAAKERAKGNKAMVVDEPPSKYSRGSRGMGYSVYFIESETNKLLRETKAKAIKIYQVKTKLEELRYLVKLLEDELANLQG